MLPKHPDQYSPEELEAWVQHLVNDKVSENPRLEYKQTILLKGEKERLEAAKDISSFANELGGTIIYGIPEDRQSDEIAIPRKPYGIESINGLESQLENIYSDSITPHLPEWRIKQVKLTEYQDKVVYVVWVPESWVGVHMVQAYGEQRYYRRGQLRAIAMSEHEVRQRYERLRNLRSAVETFLNSPELTYLGIYMPNNAFVSHYVICPAMLFPERVDFANAYMRMWLDENQYELWYWFERYPFSKWSPSAYGVRAKVSNDSGIVEIYDNGAISYWGTSVVRQNTQIQTKYRLLYLEELKAVEGFLRFGCSFYKQIQYPGPLHFRVEIENRPRVGPALNPNILFWDNSHNLITHDGSLSINLTETGSKLLENPNLILKQIADRLFRTFGLWEADCFDVQLNLKRP